MSDASTTIFHNAACGTWRNAPLVKQVGKPMIDIKGRRVAC